MALSSRVLAKLCETFSHFFPANASSLPLAGLVLVDPLLLPESGRDGSTETTSNGGRETRWDTSLHELIAMLDDEASGTTRGDVPRSQKAVLRVGAGNGNGRRDAAPGPELALLRTLARAAAERRGGSARPLRLEPGATPTLACYSGDHGDLERYRAAAERTAAFHAGDHVDQVPVMEVHKKEGDGDGDRVDDLEMLSRTIYQWYEEVVA